MEREATIRHATWDDLAPVAALFAARDTARHGRPELSAEELAHDWGTEGFALASDAWLAQATDGTVLAYADLLPDHPGTWAYEIALHPADEHIELERTLRARVEQRAAAAAAAGGLAEARLRAFLPSHERAALDRLRGDGYRFVCAFLRMRLDADAPAPAQPWPAGVQAAEFDPERDAEAVHAVLAEAFEDHVDVGGPGSYAQWRREVLGHPRLEPALWVLAREGERLVGAVVAFPEDGYGWVKALGVLRAARGRGIAAALLGEAIRRLRAHGLAAVELGVDAASPTGATRLYERAGMRLVRRTDVYEKRVPARA